MGSGQVSGFAVIRQLDLVLVTLGDYSLPISTEVGRRASKTSAQLTDTHLIRTYPNLYQFRRDLCGRWGIPIGD